MKYIRLILTAAVAVLLTTACAQNTSQKTQNPQSTAQETQNNTPIQETPIKEATNSTGLPLKIAGNFSISPFATGIKNPRVAYVNADNGPILVSSPGSGEILALPDTNKDGSADEKIVVVNNLNDPHGVQVLCNPTEEVKGCRLYVAETDKVSYYDYDPKTATATNKKKILDLPAGGNHSTRSLAFIKQSDNTYTLLVSIGSTCNVCNEQDKRRAAIWSADLEGKNFKAYATGLRNSVFMTIHPATHELWATEMGRDNLGDELPPEEINIIKEGKNYGWPICYGQNVHDTDFDKNFDLNNPCKEPTYTSAHITLPAHSAPLGLAFITSQKWPQEFQNNALVANHGSWNRTKPTGYKIARIKLDAQGTFQGREDFITGWLDEKNTVHGRPVDLKFDTDGSLYITDDKRGVIYKVTPNS
jgi:glucose/arabinose dehydrogenase